MFGFGNNNKDSYGSRLNDWFKTGSTVGSGIGSYMNTGSAPWGTIAKGAKGLYGLTTGHNDNNYSDFEEPFVYTLQGAGQGASFGPWGALGGALYGLGYSFKDDIGLKDNNFLTNMIFPIGMGDDHKGLIQV